MQGGHGRALAEAGLHPATGGDGTGSARATCCCRRWWPAPASRSARWRSRSASTSGAGTVRADGDLDFRGTLAVDKEAPVGLRATSADSASNSTPTRGRGQLATLLRLTERFCVVYQTLPAISGDQRRAADDRLITWPSG